MLHHYKNNFLTLYNKPEGDGHDAYSVGRMAFIGAGVTVPHMSDQHSIGPVSRYRQAVSCLPSQYEAMVTLGEPVKQRARLGVDPTHESGVVALLYHHVLV